MALKLDKLTNYNVTANYWKIIKIRYDYLLKVGVFYLALYLNKNARDSGCEPIEVIPIVFPNLDEGKFLVEEESSSSIRNQIYKELKKTILSDAEDI